MSNVTATDFASAVSPNGNQIEAQVVRLRNDGDTTFSQKYGGVKYTIPPKSELIVPFMAMCLWLGHPNAVDIDKKRRWRTQEFQRLCVKWGVYEHHEKVQEMFPKVSAWDVVNPQREFITVVKDPDGKHLTPDVQTKFERETLMEQMRQMQSQLAALQAQINQNDQQTAADIAAGDTRTDNPTVRPEVQVQAPTVTPTVGGNPAGPLPDPDSLDTPPVDETGGATVDRPTPRPVARQ